MYLWYRVGYVIWVLRYRVWVLRNLWCRVWGLRSFQGWLLQFPLDNGSGVGVDLRTLWGGCCICRAGAGRGRGVWLRQKDENVGYRLWCLKLWVWGLGFWVWGLGFGVEGLIFGIGDWGLGFGVWGLRFGVCGLGCEVWGVG